MGGSRWQRNHGSFSHSCTEGYIVEKKKEQMCACFAVSGGHDINFCVLPTWNAEKENASYDEKHIC